MTTDQQPNERLFDIRDTACPYFGGVQLFIMFSEYGNVRLLCWFLGDEGVCEHEGSKGKFRDGICPLVKRMGILRRIRDT